MAIDISKWTGLDETDKHGGSGKWNIAEDTQGDGRPVRLERTATPGGGHDDIKDGQDQKSKAESTGRGEKIIDLEEGDKDFRTTSAELRILEEWRQGEYGPKKGESDDRSRKVRRSQWLHETTE